MKIKQIILIALTLYFNCQGASKSIHMPEHFMTTAAMPASFTAQISADTKAATDASSKTKSGGSAGSAAIDIDTKTTTESSFALETQKRDRSYECVDTLEDHTDVVQSIIQLKDGRLASCSDDQTIRIWTEQYQCVNILEGHTADVNSIIQLKDGKLASCSHDRTIRIWDLSKPEGKECVNILYHTNAINRIIQLTDGRLASCSWDKTIRIWDLSKYECVDVLKGHTGSVNCIIQLADGRLASVSDGTIQIWYLNKDKGKYECADVLEGHTGSVNCIIQLADGRLASCSHDETMRIWNLRNPENQSVAVLNVGSAFSITQLPNGRLALGLEYGEIHIWNLSKPQGNNPKNDQEQYQCVEVLKGHKNLVKSIVQLTDGRLASCSADETIRIWDQQQPEIDPSELECLPTVVSDTKTALDSLSKSKSCGSAGSAAIDDTKTTAESSFALETQKRDRSYECVTILKLKDHTRDVNSIIQLADGRLALCSSSFDKTIHIWDLTKPKGRQCVDVIQSHHDTSIIELKDGKLASYSFWHNNKIRIWKLNDKGKYECADVLEGHTGSVNCIIQLADGRFASCSADNTIRIWDLNSNDKYICVAVLEGHTGVNSMIQLTDRRLASCSADNTIRIWDLSKNKGNDPKNDQRCVDVIMSYHKSIIPLKNGKLALYSHDNTIRIWDLSKKQGNDPKNDNGKYECAVLTGHTDWVMSLIQLKDGKLASCSHDRTIRIWDLNDQEQYKCVNILEGHTADVNSIIQLKDGKLASCSYYDETIRIWDLSNPKGKECVDILKDHISAMQLTDGRLASRSRDGTIHIWKQNCNIDPRLDLLQPLTSPPTPITTQHNNDRLSRLLRYLIGLRSCIPKLEIM